MHQIERNLNEEANSYINMAFSGHYPLFFKEWLYEAGLDQKKMDHFKAKKVFFKTLKKLSKHKNPDRKKMALCSLSDTDRKDFVKAWMKLAEAQTLKAHTELH